MWGKNQSVGGVHYNAKPPNQSLGWGMGMCDAARGTTAFERKLAVFFSIRKALYFL